MSIVTQEIIEQRGNDVRLRFVDHLGKEYYESWQLKPGTDANAFLANRVPVVEANTVDSELTDALAVASRGTNPDRVPEYQTQADFDRRLLGRLMTVTSIDTKITAIPFWLAVETRGGANANQRAAYLGVTRPEYDLVSGLFGDLQGVAGGVNTVNGQLWLDVRGAWL